MWYVYINQVQLRPYSVPYISGKSLQGIYIREGWLYTSRRCRIQVERIKQKGPNTSVLNILMKWMQTLARCQQTLKSWIL